MKMKLGKIKNVEHGMIIEVEDTEADMIFVKSEVLDGTDLATVAFVSERAAIQIANESLDEHSAEVFRKALGRAHILSIHGEEAAAEYDRTASMSKKELWELAKSQGFPG